MQCFPCSVPASWAKPGLCHSPENPKLAASCWQGIPSRLLVLLRKKGEFQKPGGCVVHRGSVCFSLPHHGTRAYPTHLVVVGIMKTNNSWQLISVKKVFTHIPSPFSMCSYLSFNDGIRQVDSARNIKVFAKCCGGRAFHLTSFFQPGLAPKLVFLTRLFAT